MNPARLSVLGILLVLSGCEIIGPKEIAGWNRSRSDRAQIVYTRHTDRSPTQRKNDLRDVEGMELRGSDVALARDRSASTKKRALVLRQPATYNSPASLNNQKEFKYVAGPDGTVQLPAPRKLSIIDVSEIRRALRGSAGLDFAGSM